MRINHVVLCGGQGKRLWPLSRTTYPKPFLPLLKNNQTLYQATLSRCRSLSDMTTIVTHQDYQDLIKTGLEGKTHQIILETDSKNTAPAILLAAMNSDPEDILLVTPSDHYIKNEDVFIKEAKTAIEIAKEGKLLSFGIVPSAPETGYGYIRKGPLFKEINQQQSYEIELFKEKPDLALAIDYIESGAYLWNSGIFCFEVKTLLTEYEKIQPKLYKEVQKLNQIKQKNNNTITFKKRDMNNITSISIDYALMEHSKRGIVLGSSLNWTDLGSLEQLQILQDIDGQKNTKHPLVNCVDSKNNVIIPNQRHIATIGVDNLIIADTPDAILISKRGTQSQRQTLVETLRKQTPKIVNNPIEEQRPWGQFKVIHEREGFKVKEIIVFPKKRLSLQKHPHRSEHWVVTEGSAVATVDMSIITLQKGESISIQKGTPHRIENQNSENLKIIEIQYGDYLGEDDIIRIEDDFNRT